MVATLDFQLKDARADLFDGARWSVLTMFILHSNNRNRSWPSMRGLAERLGKSLPHVTAAKQWLIDHGAVALVPYELRTGEEKNIPNHQHLYELTGKVTFDDGLTINYLHISPDNGKFDDQSGESSKRRGKRRNDQSGESSNSMINSVDDQNVSPLSIPNKDSNTSSNTEVFSDSANRDKSLSQEKDSLNSAPDEVGTQQAALQSKQSVADGSRPEEKTPIPVANALSPAPVSVQAFGGALPEVSTLPASPQQILPAVAPVETNGQLPAETKQEASTTVLEAIPDHAWITSAGLGSKRHLAKSEKGHALCGEKVPLRVGNGEPTGEHPPCEKCLEIAKTPKPVKTTPTAYSSPLIYDTIAEVVWGIKPDADDKAALEGGRCGKIRQRLVAHVLRKRKVADLDEATIAELVGHIRKFGKWYDTECQGCDRPKDPVKFMERWLQYTQSAAARASDSRPRFDAKLGQWVTPGGATNGTGK